MSSKDWSVLDIEGVDRIIKLSVDKIVRHHNLTVEDAEDLEQEATTLVVDVRNYGSYFHNREEPELGKAQYALEADLIDAIKREVRHSWRHDSYEQRYAAELGETEAVAPMKVRLSQKQDTARYDADMVKALIPAIWDEEYAYGMRVENAPDHDMPRSAPNLATGNTLAAHIADIKIAWERTPLTLPERRALILGYGMDWRQADVAYNQGVSQQAIQVRLKRGVEKIVKFLNGSEIDALGDLA